MSVLAIIPARGGSKGVPRKNLCKVGSRSLVGRAINVAIQSPLVDHVLVSTDDDEIAQEARDCGAEVPFMRPPELAGDEIASVAVIEHAVGEYEAVSGRAVSVIVLLEPTVPFRLVTHVTAALERYRRGDCRSVIAVCPLERKPQNILRKCDGETVERYIREPAETFTRRQEMEHLCRLSSGAYVVGRDDFLAERRLVIEPVGYVESGAIESINIDEELDLLLAELVAEKYGL
jgi:CMP-N-acetylneuraminic acid synthetase